MQAFIQSSIFLSLPWANRLPVVTLLLTVILCGLLMLKRLISNSRKRNENPLPPGPTGVPILGYLPFIRKPYHIVFKELSEQYGPIIRVRLGFKDVVVLNDLASIRQGLTNPDVLFRPEDFVFRYLGVTGIGTVNGYPWLVNRRYCFHVLRNLGFAKKSMAEHMQEEVESFCDFLASKKGQPSVIAQPLTASVANNISALIFGERYERGDPRSRFTEGLLTKFLHHGSFFSIMDFLPFLRVLSAYIPDSKIDAMDYVFKQFKLLVRKEVREREGNMEAYMDRDFIDGYLRKIEENKGLDSHYGLGYLEGNTINIFGASNNTVRSAILWYLYIVASDPDHLQMCVQREIDDVVGRHSVPEWEDRRRMPFTMASILETLRWRTTAPIGIQRATSCDTVIGGYQVPAGTFVVANLWSLHNDPFHWHNPSHYDPMRFLTADGLEMAEKPRAFLPFSLGRRACPGETLALMEMFLYATTVLQRFTVLPEEGKTISLDAKYVLISVVDDTQRLRFIPRPTATPDKHHS